MKRHQMFLFVTVLMLSFSNVRAQDLTGYYEATPETAAKYNWKPMRRELSFKVQRPHEVEMIFRDDDRRSKVIDGVVNYSYQFKYIEEITPVITAGKLWAINIERFAHYLSGVIPNIVLQPNYKMVSGTIPVEESDSGVSYNIPTFELGRSRLVFKLDKSTQTEFPFYSLDSLKKVITLPQVNREEKTSPIASIFSDSRRIYAYDIAPKLDTFKYALIENPIPETAQSLREALAAEMANMTKAAPLSSIGDVKFYLNAQASKLQIKVREYFFVFENVTVKNSFAEGFSSSLLPEVKVLLKQLEKLKDYLRPDVYQQTYGQMRTSLLNLKLLLEEKKLNHLSSSVQNQYESIFFLYRNILLRDMDKDKKVEYYGELVNDLCNHLEHCNNSFFQFDPGMPSSAIISMIAKHVSLMLEKSKWVVDKQRLPQAEALKNLINQMYLPAFELSVSEAVGDADVKLLNDLDQLLDLYQTNSARLEAGLKLHRESQLLFEQINLGMSFLRKIRE